MRRIFGVSLLVVFCFSALSVQAQQQEKRRDYAAEALEKADKFPETKVGCRDRASMFVAIKQKYVEGVLKEDVFDSKMMEPMVEEMYAELKAKGPDEAMLDNIKGYIGCVEKMVDADPVKPDERKAELRRTCDKVGTMVLDSLEAVKAGRSKESLIAKYASVGADDPALAMYVGGQGENSLVGRIYGVSETHSLGSALEFSYGTILSCYSRL